MFGFDKVEKCAYLENFKRLPRQLFEKRESDRTQKRKHEVQGQFNPAPLGDPSWSLPRRTVLARTMRLPRLLSHLQTTQAAHSMRLA